MFRDNGITGILAFKDWDGSADYLILPYDLTDAQRDLILWGYEVGHRDGFRRGEDKIRTDFKRLMGIAT